MTRKEAEKYTQETPDGSIQWEEFRPQPEDVWQAGWQDAGGHDPYEYQPEYVGMRVGNCFYPGGLATWKFRRPVPPVTAAPEITRSQFDRMTNAEKVQHNLPAFLALETSPLEYLDPWGNWQDGTIGYVSICYPYRVKPRRPDLAWKLESADGTISFLLSPTAPPRTDEVVRVVQMVEAEVK